MRRSHPLLLHDAVIGFVLSVFLCGAEAQVANGDFETGTLAPWAPFTTANGTLGPGFPTISTFDVDGDGVSSLAFAHSVGYLVAPCAAPGILCPSPAEGGGISQAVTFLGGLTTFHADVAVANSTASGGYNADGGTFALFLDGVLLDQVSFVDIVAGTVLRGQLDFTGVVATGSHTLELLTTRSYAAASSVTQYIDGVSAAPTVSVVPEPETAVLLGVGLLALIGSQRGRRARRR